MKKRILTYDELGGELAIARDFMNLFPSYKTTEKGRFLWFNELFLPHFGFNPDDTLELFSADDLYFDPDDREEFKETIKKSKENSVVMFEVPLRKLDGSIMYNEIYVRQREQKEGIVYTGSLVDTTHHKIDGRTGIYRPEQLTTVLKYHKKDFKKYGTPFLFVIGDVDWFKLYNESFGYEQANLALETIGGVIRSVVKRKGSYLRFGGEEFVIILPNTTKDSAVDFVRSFMGNLENTEIPLGKDLENKIISYPHKTPKKVTMSLGAVQVDKESNLNLENLVIYANIALLEAKKNHNKNTFCFYEQGKVA